MNIRYTAQLRHEDCESGSLSNYHLWLTIALERYHCVVCLFSPNVATEEQSVERRRRFTAASHAAFVLQQEARLCYSLQQTSIGNLHSHLRLYELCWIHLFIDY